MRVLILGLGQYPQGSGVEAATYFATGQHEVIVTDLKSEDELRDNVKRLRKYKNVIFHLSGHLLSDIEWADVIVVNPRVRFDSPWLIEAQRLSKRIESDLTIFFAACPAPIIGITGTRGKSTTTALLADMLRAHGDTVFVGGNISTSPLVFLHRLKPTSRVVLEISSWQLEALGRAGFSPRYAIWINLMRDHLNTYTSMQDYADAKAHIFLHQEIDGVVCLPEDASFDAYASRAIGYIHRVGVHHPLWSWLSQLSMCVPGEHVRLNALFAAVMAEVLGVTRSEIAQALSLYSGLPDRQEKIATIDGVDYINDTTATTPDATMAAIRTYRDHNLKLIFGGADKELEFDEVAKQIYQEHIQVYLLPGTAFDKIVAAFQRHKVEYAAVNTLEAAVTLATNNLKPGDIILLSPGCASFGLFKNEFDRGQQFREIVSKLVKVDGIAA